MARPPTPAPVTVTPGTFSSLQHLPSFSLLSIDSPFLSLRPSPASSSQGLPPESVGDEPSFTVRSRHRISGFCEDVCCYIPGSTEEAFPVPKSFSSAPFTPSTHTGLRAGKTGGTQWPQGLMPVLGSSHGRQTGGPEG